ncbi:MAG: MFS transporter [Bacteroidota bacterium]
MKGLRWWVITLIALATVINYIDRQSLGVLWPEIAKDLYPDNTADERKEIYGIISGVFIFAYAFGQAIFGKIFDWVGTRIGFALSIGIWSIATALHALARGVMSFAIFRVILGVAEAGNWPGAAKGNAEWFPTKERAFAQGLFNSGAAIGGIISIPLIAFLTVYFSWQSIFILVGITGLLWLVPWMILVKAPPEKHPWISAEERNYILSGQKNQDLDGDGAYDEGYNPPTGEMLSRKESWGVIIASAAIDPIWWLFVVWIPIYLNEVYQMDVKTIGIYGWVPYVGAMVGAWFGGLLAQNRIKAGWNVNKTRKLVITLGCLIMLPALLAMSNPGSPSTAVIIMAIILFGFQTAIGNVQTLPSDFYGKKSVGTLAGLSGMAAKFGAFGLTVLIPMLTAGGNFTPAFIIGAALALIALAAIWILCPKIEPLKPKNSTSSLL